MYAQHAKWTVGGMNRHAHAAAHIVFQEQRRAMKTRFGLHIAQHHGTLGVQRVASLRVNIRRHGGLPHHAGLPTHAGQQKESLFAGQQLQNFSIFHIQHLGHLFGGFRKEHVQIGADQRLAAQRGQDLLLTALALFALSALKFADVDKGDHHTFNFVLDGAIREEPQFVPAVGPILHGGFNAFGRIAHLRRQPGQIRMANAMGDVVERAPLIRGNEVKKFGGARRKAANAQARVQKDSPHVG